MHIINTTVKIIAWFIIASLLMFTLVPFISTKTNPMNTNQDIAFMQHKEVTKEERSAAMQSTLQHSFANMTTILSILAIIYLTLNWVSWQTDKTILLTLVTCVIVSVIISVRSGKEAVDYMKKHPDLPLTQSYHPPPCLSGEISHPISVTRFFSRWFSFTSRSLSCARRAFSRSIPLQLLKLQDTL